MNKELEIEKYVLDGFSSKASLSKYKNAADQGLWDSENKIISKYFNKKGKTLDVGCGTGRTTLGLKKLGFDVVGIDMVPAFIEHANDFSIKSGFNIKYFTENICETHFRDEEFDNVLFSFNGFMQIPGCRRIKALKQIHRILKSEGVFIFTCYKRDFLNKPFFWTIQFIKTKLNKFLKMYPGVEFGDIIFTKKVDDEKYTQYMHIPDLKQLKQVLEREGFMIYTIIERDLISESDKNLGSSNCFFFVCHKKQKCF